MSKNNSIWDSATEVPHVGAYVDVKLNNLTFGKIMRHIMCQKSGTVDSVGSNIHTDFAGFKSFLNEFKDKFPARLIYGAAGSSDDDYEDDTENDDMVNERAEGEYIRRTQIFLFETSALQITFTGDHINLHGLFTDVNLFKEIDKLANKFATPYPEPERAGYVYAVIKDGMGRLQLHNIGYAGMGLHEENYSASVVKQYRAAIEDFDSSDPSGRVVILEGVPGSGKTHLVRSFLTDADNATFILIPPDMITELSGPTFLPLLISYCGNNEAPIVLVLEDADRCLVTRDDKNMNAIQALLNLSDGILGSMLDIRILATTNATKLDLEPALLRPGRLSQRIEVNQLNAKESRACFEHLLPGVPFPASLKGKNTVAEIYLAARGLGWKASAKE